MEYRQYELLNEKLDKIQELLLYIAYPELKPKIEEEKKFKSGI